MPGDEKTGRPFTTANIDERSLELRQESPQAPEVEVARQDSERIRKLEICLMAQRGFVEALDELMEAAQHPPHDSEVMVLLERALASVMEVTDSEDGALLIRDEDTDRLVFVVTRGEVPSDELVWSNIPPDRGIAQWVVQHRCAAIVNNVAHDERFYNGIDKAHEFHTRSILAVPVMDEDRLIGVVEVLNKKDGSLFTLADQHRLELMCHFDGKLLARIVERSGAR